MYVYTIFVIILAKLVNFGKFLFMYKIPFWGYDLGVTVEKF